MGNICRSPAAHCVFQEMVNKQTLPINFSSILRGRLGFRRKRARWSDARCIEKRKIPVIGQSRQIRKSDLEDFDIILAMDHSNLTDAKSLDLQATDIIKSNALQNSAQTQTLKTIPDPYYGYRWL